MNEEKKISRYDIATVKRCYQSTKRYRTVKAKLVAKKEALESEIAKLDTAINELDAPARTLCGLDSEAFLIQQGILKVENNQPAETPETTEEQPTPEAEAPQPEAEERLTE